MDFTSIFNGESLTLAQFNEKTKGMKLADLSTGEYVAKGKDKEQIPKAAARRKGRSDLQLGESQGRHRRHPGGA